MTALHRTKWFLPYVQLGALVAYVAAVAFLRWRS